MTQKAAVNLPGLTDKEQTALRVLSDTVEAYGSYLLSAEVTVFTKAESNQTDQPWVDSEIFPTPMSTSVSHASLYSLGAINLLIGTAISAPQSPLFCEEAQAQAKSMKSKADALTAHGRNCGLLTASEDPKRNLSDIIPEMLKGNDLIGEQLANMTYRHLSGYAHLNPLSLLERKDPEATETDQQKEGCVNLRPTFNGSATTLFLAAVACEVMCQTIARSQDKTLDVVPFQKVLAAFAVGAELTQLDGESKSSS